MIFGLQKRQGFLLLLALSAPLLLNFVAIWQDVGTASIRKMWVGGYPAPFVGFLGGPYNPLPEIAGRLLLFAAVLGIVAWLIILLTNQDFFQRQPQMIRCIEIGVLSLLTAVVFTVVAVFLMPLIWLPMFHDYLLGLPGLPLAANWGWWMILPFTLVLFIVIFVSRG